MNRFLLCLCLRQYLFGWHPINSFRFVELMYQGALGFLLGDSFCEFDALQKLLISSAEFYFRAKTGSRMKMGIVFILFPVNIEIYYAFRNIHLKESDFLFNAVNDKMSCELRRCKPPIFEFELRMDPKHNVGVLIVVSAQARPQTERIPGIDMEKKN